MHLRHPAHARFSAMASRHRLAPASRATDGRDVPGSSSAARSRSSSGARQELHESLQSAVKRITTERERVTRLEETMSELDGQLKDNRLEDVQQLESKTP